MGVAGTSEGIDVVCVCMYVCVCVYVCVYVYICDRL